MCGDSRAAEAKLRRGTRRAVRSAVGINEADEVLKYCKVELLQDNYFHAVFSSKGRCWQ